MSSLKKVVFDVLSFWTWFRIYCYYWSYRFRNKFGM